MRSTTCISAKTGFGCRVAAASQCRSNLSPLGPLCNVCRSNKKYLSALELCLGAPILKIMRYVVWPAHYVGCMDP